MTCICYVTDEKYWFRYGSAVEPGSQMEPNPDCPEHFPTREGGKGPAAVIITISQEAKA